jgi:alkanesulfonate monooxygenase SsuD/methylene tetrahydromethanopterin reductase-like flavin-dependent oxidoreductase (luciferase family)
LTAIPGSEIFATVYVPIEMLTFAVARTRKVKLGTSVMSALFQNPVTLARRFATLDRLSDGRAIAGIGQGDFRDEFEAANIPIKRRGRGFEEFVKAIRAVWGPDPVSFTGDFYNIPESRIGPKPVQSGGIPMLLGAFAPASLERAARIADGIMPAAGRSTTIEKLSQTINNFRDMVRRAGRKPEELKWILRVHNPLGEEKAREPRALLEGTPPTSRTGFAESQGAWHRSRILRHESSGPSSNRHSTSAAQKARPADQGLGMRSSSRTFFWLRQ